MTDWITSDQTDVAEAIKEFKATLPGWWYSIGECSVSSDASCGPDRTGPDADLLKITEFDHGFHCDLLQPAKMAESLREVMTQALAARARVKDQTDA